MAALFDKTELCGMTLKNRFFRSATWDGLARPDGSLTDDLYAIYENVAKGGVGAIVTPPLRMFLRMIGRWKAA